MGKTGETYWRNVAEASRAFAEVALDYDRAVEVVARELADRVGAYCIVRLRSDDEKTMDVVSCAHTDASRVNALLEIAEALQTDDAPGLEGFLVAPLVCGDSDLGELLLGRESNGANYADQEVLLARELAQRAAILIRDA